MRRAIPALAVAMAAVVVGCGGGGGAAKGTAASATSGAPVDPTGGAITTGGTTGASATTGTTGSGTTGTSVPTGTTGDPTTGTATTGATTGGAPGTTGSDGTGTATAGSGTTTTEAGTTGADTGGTDAGGTDTGGTSGAGTTGTDGTGTGTDGSGTTGSGTTGSGTTGTGTTGDPVPSPYPLRPNAIYFGHANDPSLVSSVYADGTGRQDRGGAAADVVAAVPDPDTFDSYVYVATVAGRSGVYRGATFDPTRDAQLAAPNYDYVSTLQAGANGAVIIVAGRNGATSLLLLEGGAIRTIDAADGAAISADAAQIAYTKPDANGVEDLYVWSRATGSRTGLATGGDALLPSFSKDGAWVLFSSSRDDANGASFDLYQVPSGGGTVERITSTPTVNEFGACYNEARTQVSYVGLSDDPNLNGVYALSNLGATRIASDDDLAFATYWTNSLGRGRGGVRGARFQRIPSSVRGRGSRG